VIVRFIREIGRADELGSGVRKLMKYGKAYSGSDPELVEGNLKGHDDLTLLCVPPTRLARPCRRVLTQMLKNIEAWVQND
jgi:hypothetical protein